MKTAPFLALWLIVAFVPLTARSQAQNTVTLSGGYSFASIEESDASATGWRANLLFEQGRPFSPITHGGAVGLAVLKSSVTTQLATSDYTITTLPVYYVPKYSFGSDDFKGFIKGALGLQFSWLTRKGTIGELSDNDLGFYGGLGGGMVYHIDEKWFVTAEYEWAYMSNSYYRDGFLNSIMAGVGMRL